jgi:acetylornithine deacetylase
MHTELKHKALDLLKNLIEQQSFSGEENETALLIMQWFSDHHIKFESSQHNVWARNKYFDPVKPTMLLNSHHDTVRPNKGYTKDPFKAEIEDGKLYGLGSNDAGGCLVALLATFVHFYEQQDLKFNLVMAATAEEENSGPNGLNSLLNELPEIDFALVGEPTGMQMAVAEKGLMVLDCYAKGEAGHAAHGLGENAIYKAIRDIEWFKTYKFPKVSETLGEVRMTVTQVEAGHQHNVIPALCRFVVDVRVTDAYSNQEVLDIIKNEVQSEVAPRSMRLNSSSIPVDHPLVNAGLICGRSTYGSPTLSDQAALSCPSMKMGPGDSYRSHSADEFIGVEEIEEGIELYINILTELLK